MFAAMCHVCLRERDEKEGTGSLITTWNIIALDLDSERGMKKGDIDSERGMRKRGLKDLALRFFIYQYDLVYHLNITKQCNQHVLVISLYYCVIGQIFAHVPCLCSLSNWCNF